MLRLIIEEKIVTLLRRSRVTQVDAVLDAAFLKAWSIRHPEDGRAGFSDPDAMVGRNDRGYHLAHAIRLTYEIILKYMHINKITEDVKIFERILFSWKMGVGA